MYGILLVCKMQMQKQQLYVGPVYDNNIIQTQRKTIFVMLIPDTCSFHIFWHMYTFTVYSAMPYEIAPHLQVKNNQ